MRPTERHGCWYGEKWNRFEQIVRLIHFADNTQVNPNDKMDLLKKHFLEYPRST